MTVLVVLAILGVLLFIAAALFAYGAVVVASDYDRQSEKL